MFVCLCHAVTDKEVKSTIRGGAKSVEEVAEQCGAGGGCGMCHEQIKELIEDEKSCGSLRRPLAGCPVRPRPVTSPLIPLRGHGRYEGR